MLTFISLYSKESDPHAAALEELVVQVTDWAEEAQHFQKEVDLVAPQRQEALLNDTKFNAQQRPPLFNEMQEIDLNVMPAEL